MKKIGIVIGGQPLPNRNYHNALQAAGASVIDLCDEAFRYQLPELDGVLFPGGTDLNPALYGEENTASEGIDDTLDRYQLDVLDAALACSLPVFGICRGHQLFNVYFGGTLLQDINRQIHTKDGPEDRVHGTRVEKSSFLYSLYGSEHINVNSSHHQAVGQLAPSLQAIQFSDDGQIEAMRHRTLAVASVQWHPERTCLAWARPDTVNGLAVFRWFLQQC